MIGVSVCLCVLIFLTVIIAGFFSVLHYCLLFGSVVAHFWFLLYFFVYSMGVGSQRE